MRSTADVRPDEALEARVWDALAAVPDPEIPAVSVVDMGMVHAVEVDGPAVHVTMLPTFTGCPAIDVIRTDVAAAALLVDGVEDVRVDITFDPCWTTARITPEGRRKLEAFGIAPPQGDGPVLLQHIGLPAAAVCPFCGSRDTANENPFGPTPCRALYYCNACRNPFEQFKPV
ncbi:MAG: 1,2-phenylacetyl-CoA epoxidase subunit PaaD [Actinomycetota bacterium]